jgi:hypothetical protein
VADLVSSLRHKVGAVRSAIPPVAWARVPQLAAAVERHLSSAGPPILVLACPRTGSTWLAETLAASPGGMYLHEPLSQTWLSMVGREGEAIHYVDPLEPEPELTTAARQCFAAIPAFRRGIVRDRSAWRLSKRHSRRVIVKEVNPLAIEWILTLAQPRIIHLVRHPAAVANSRQRLGWMGAMPEPLLDFSRDRVGVDIADLADDPLALSGATQAIAFSFASSVLEDYGDWTSVSHEELSIDPRGTYQRLYEFCGLERDASSDAFIEDHIGSDVGRDENPYGLHRNSAAMVERWKDELTPSEIERIRTGFERFPAARAQDLDWGL